MWLPHLSLTKPQVGQRGAIFYHGIKVGELVSSEALVAEAGAEIVLVGSGPSVNTSDVSRIPGGSAILLNGAISLIPASIAEPLAIAIEDERFIQRHFAMLKNRVGRGTICLLSVPVLRAICEIQPDWLAGRTIILIDNVRKPYDQPRRDASGLGANKAAVLEDEGRTGFSHDPDWGVFQGGSVAVSALQFAVHCRPAKIGLLGIDISNANEPRFYEKRDAMAKSGVARATDRITAHLSLAKRIAGSAQINVINYSPVSVLRHAGFGYDARLARADVPQDPR